MNDLLLDEVVADAHARPLPTLTPRRVKLPWLPRKVDAIAGMRRSGKTWLMFQRMRELVEAGAPREDLLYVSARPSSTHRTNTFVQRPVRRPTRRVRWRRSQSCGCGQPALLPARSRSWRRGADPRRDEERHRLHRARRADQRTVVERPVGEHLVELRRLHRRERPLRRHEVDPARRQPAQPRTCRPPLHQRTQLLGRAQRRAPHADITPPPLG